MYFYIKTGDVPNSHCILPFCPNTLTIGNCLHSDKGHWYTVVVNSDIKNFQLYVVKLNSIPDFDLDFDLCLTDHGSQASIDIDSPNLTQVSMAFWLKKDITSTDNVTIQLNDRETGHMTFFIEIGSEAKIGNPR